MTIDFKSALYDDAGAPVANKTVNLYDRDTTTNVRATTTTDDAGAWAIAHGTQGRFDVEVVNGSSKRRLLYDRNEQMETLEVANFRVRNPANTFEYDIVPAAITALRTLNLPLITGTDTLASLGLAATYSAIMTHSADIIIQDASDLALGNSSDALLRWSTADSDNHALVLGLGDDNTTLHIANATNVGTDWAVSANAADAEVWIHSDTTPATDYMRLGGHDGTTAYVDVVGGTTLAFEIAGNTEATITASGLTLPANSDLLFTGGTGTNDIVLTNGLADALSITDGSADVLVIDTSTSGNVAAWTAAITAQAISGTVITGTTSGVFNSDITITSGSIVSASGTISFGNENLTTTGALTIASFAANWTNAGRTVADLGTITTVDINGGTIDGVVIGGAAAAAGSFTTLALTDDITWSATTPRIVLTNGESITITDGTNTLFTLADSGSGGTMTTANIDAIIGANTAAAGTFTTIDAGTDFTISNTVLTNSKLSVATDGLTIALAGSSPDPDNNSVHIWKATAGSITSQANSLLTLENNDQAVITFLTPNDDSSGIEFGDVDDADVGRIIYNHATDGLLIKVAATNQAIWTDGALALQKATTISTSSGDLSLTPASSADINIPADIGLTFADDGQKIESDGTDFTIASGAKLNLTATSDVHVANGTGLIVGHTASISDMSANRLGPNEASGFGPEVQILGTGAADSHMMLARYSADTFGPGLYFLKGRHASDYFDDTKVEEDDAIGTILWSGEDGNGGPSMVAELAVFIDAATADNQVGGRMLFATSASNGRTPIERMRIDSSGDIDFNNGDLLNVGAAGNDWTTNDLKLDSARSGGRNLLLVQNSSTDATSSAQVTIQTGGGSGASDARLVLSQSASHELVMGIDVSASTAVMSMSDVLGTNDILRITDATPPVVTYNSAHPTGTFDYVCETCGKSGPDPFECHGVEAPWHDDVAALVPVLSIMDGRWLDGSEPELQGLIRMGILERDHNFHEPGEDSVPWLGFNSITAQWYTWAGMYQMYQKNRQLEERIEAMEANRA